MFTTSENVHKCQTCLASYKLAVVFTMFTNLSQSVHKVRKRSQTSNVHQLVPKSVHNVRKRSQISNVHQLVPNVHKYQMFTNFVPKSVHNVRKRSQISNVHQLVPKSVHNVIKRSQISNVHQLVPNSVHNARKCLKCQNESLTYFCITPIII